MKTADEILRQVIESDFKKRKISDREWQATPARKHVLKAMELYADAHIEKHIELLLTTNKNF